MSPLPSYCSLGEAGRYSLKTSSLQELVIYTDDQSFYVRPSDLAAQLRHTDDPPFQKHDGKQFSAAVFSRQLS